MPFIEYPKEALEYLCTNDVKLKAVIERIGPVRRECNPNTFEALIHALVAQQISTKAAQAIWNRLDKYTGIDPAVIMNMDEKALCSIGLSKRKARYIQEAANVVVSGALNLNALRTMSDEQVKESLCALYGVGVWTAEMLMIFSLGRLDVLSTRDAGIMRGIKLVYNTEMPTTGFIKSLTARVSPYGTVASLYFWAVASGQ